MAQFLIETEHTPEVCVRVLDGVVQAGAHWLTKTDWGCHDGVHKAWLVVDADSRDEAGHLIPPVFRQSALLVQLNKFTAEEIRQLHEKVGQ
jgi:hypothetical protein